MKFPRNIFFILFTCLSTLVFGQNYGNQSRFSFCKHTGETISLNDLNKCKTVVSKNKNVEIKSFVVAVFIKVKSDTLFTVSGFEEGGIYRDFKITGNVLSKEVLDFFKQKQEEKQHLKIEITDIIAVENGKEGNYDGFVFYLH
jgi:hypothetical protein